MKAIYLIIIFFIGFFLVGCTNDIIINNSNPKSSIIGNNTNLTNGLINNSGSIANSGNIFGEIAITSLGTGSYKLSGSLNGHFKKISVVWEFDKMKDSPYLLNKYLSGSNNFEYYIRPEFNTIKQGINLYIFTGEKDNGTIETKEITIEEKNFNPDNVIYNNIINPKDIKSIKGFNLIKFSTSPNKQYKYELYSKGNECGCYAYACILNIKEISNNKILKQYITKHDGPCDSFYSGINSDTFGDILKWKDNSNLLVSDGMSDGIAGGKTYGIFDINSNIIKDKILYYSYINNLFNDEKSGMYYNLYFNNHVYWLLNINSGSTLYESKDVFLNVNNSIYGKEFISIKNKFLKAASFDYPTDIDYKFINNYNNLIINIGNLSYNYDLQTKKVIKK